MQPAGRGLTYHLSIRIGIYGADHNMDVRTIFAPDSETEILNHLLKLTVELVLMFESNYKLGDDAF